MTLSLNFLSFRTFAAFVLFVSFSFAAYGQQEIDVDMYTGTPSIQVPFTSATHHDISFPVYLNYNANGIRNREQAGYFGLGWNLVAGGSVSRQVKGLPDDFSGPTGDDRRGWLHNRVGGSRVGLEVANFSASADLVASTCSDEQADNTTLQSWNYKSDTEPDVFSFNLPGASGSFFFDNGSTPTIRTMPYQDVDITYTTALNAQILSFTIRTNDGFKYIFNEVVTVSKSIRKNTAIDNMTFFEREYRQYDGVVFGFTGYAQEWKLTRIESPSGAFVDLHYTELSAVESERPVRIGIYDRNFATPPANLLSLPQQVKEVFTVNTIVTDQWLNSITGSSGQEIEFTRNGSLLHKVIQKDNRRTDPFVKEHLLQYNGELLVTVSEQSGCDKLPPYVFEYLPSGTEYVEDFWGFPNGKDNRYHHIYSNPAHYVAPQEGDLLPRIFIYPSEPLAERFRFYPIPNYSGTQIVLDGTDRLPDENAMMGKSLNRITFPGGGSAVLRYEAHRYHDTRAGVAQVAGGLRIRSIAQYDGMNRNARVEKEFAYTDPANGNSSGKLIAVPQFILPVWKYRDPAAMNDLAKDLEFADLSGKSEEERWKHLTVRTESDISEQNLTRGSTVGYQFVTVKRIGAGRAEYEFSVPAAYGEAAFGSWTPTETKFVRTSACESMGLISQGGAWGFPFAQNPEIDHERGLMIKKTEFDESNNRVRLIENTYQYIYKNGSLSHQMWGLKYDRFASSESNIFFYGKYFLRTDYRKVLQQETVTEYDAANINKKIINSTQYFYDAPSHRLLTKVVNTVGDGTILTTRMRYAVDFGSIAANSEPALLRIKDLQDAAKFRHATLIEKWSAIQKPGDSERVTGAALTLMSDFGTTGKVLTESVRSLRIAAGVTDFAYATAVLNAGTYKLSADLRYVTTNTILAYDAFDRPASLRGRDRAVTSTVWGFNQTIPVASVVNASKNEFAFSDFETTSAQSFTVTNGYNTAPRTGTNGLHPYALLRKIITKSTDQYTLMFWFKGTSATNIRVRVLNTPLTTTYFDETIVCGPSATEFIPITKTINISAAPAAFVIELVGQSLSPPPPNTLLPSIDDVSFLPKDASVVSSTYDFPYGTSSTTNAVNRTSYTHYDKIGRVSFTRDHEGNIRSRNEYKFPVDQAKLDATFTIPLEVKPLTDDGGDRIFGYYKTAYRGDQVTFTASGNPCIQNVSYEWKIFENNSSLIATFSNAAQTQSYTFSSIGNYRVELTVTAQGETTATSSDYFIVVKRPVELTVCAAGTTQWRCGQQVYVSNGCPSNPLPPTGVVFYASMGETIPGTTYTWKKRFIDDETWVTVGTNSNQYSILNMSPAPHAQRSFFIKCEVTEPGGRSGESNSVPIDVAPCE